MNRCSQADRSSEPCEILRSLRRSRKLDGKRLTIETLEFLSGVSHTLISALENGHLQSVKVETLDRIVTALSKLEPIPYSDKNVIFQAFGFKMDNSLPTAVDVERAVQAWVSKKEGANPVYLTDFAFRIHDWNDLIPQFLGLPRGSDIMKSMTLIDLAFSERFKPEMPSIVILNREEYLMAWLEDIKTELSRFEQEAWHHEFVASHSQKYPAFKQLWETVPCKKVSVWEPKLLPTIQISIDGSDPLQFRVEGPELSTDPRFRVNEFKPWDAETSMKCFALLAKANACQREVQK